MFSFSKLALFFTLGAAAFSAAAPVLNDVKVNHNEVEARCDHGCPTSSDGAQVSLHVTIQTLIDTVTPICADIKTYTKDTITVEVVEKATADITAAVQIAITNVKALAGASLDVIVGVKVDISVCIKLVAQVFVLIFETLGFLLSICIKIDVKVLLVACGKIVIELLVAIVALLQTVGGVIGLVLVLLRSLLAVVFHIVVKLGLQVELGACLGITIN